MRTGGGHLGEVLGNGAEGLMLLVGEDEGELALVHAIHVDLLMVESG